MLSEVPPESRFCGCVSAKFEGLAWASARTFARYLSSFGVCVCVSDPNIEKHRGVFALDSLDANDQQSRIVLASLKSEFLSDTASLTP